MSDVLDVATSAPPAAAPVHATRAERLVNLGVAVVAGVVLAMAISLSADARGHGTHQQLGLPP